MPRVRKATTTKTDPQVGSRRSARIRKTEPESGLLPGLEVPEPKKKAVTSKPKPKPKTKPKPKSKATQKKKFVRKADEPENYKAREGVQRHHKWYYLYSNEDEEERLRAYKAEPPKNFEAKKQRAVSQPIGIVNRVRYTVENPPLEIFQVFGAGSTGDFYDYEVRIDLIPTCECQDFGFRRQACKHIIYVLHYVLKEPLSSPLLYQTAYLTTELRHLMRPETAATQPDSYILRTTPASDVASFEAMLKDPSTAPDAPYEVRYADENRKVIEGDCPVCYMEFDPVTEAIGYCRVACGNSMHVGCMRLWVMHQSKVEKNCPYCRGRWV